MRLAFDRHSEILELLVVGMHIAVYDPSMSRVKQ